MTDVWGSERMREHTRSVPDWWKVSLCLSSETEKQKKGLLGGLVSLSLFGWTLVHGSFGFPMACYYYCHQLHTPQQWTLSKHQGSFPRSPLQERQQKLGNYPVSLTSVCLIMCLASVCICDAASGNFSTLCGYTLQMSINIEHCDY